MSSEERKACEAVNAGMKALSKGAEKKIAASIQLCTELNWQNFVSPAPMSICLLGQLMCISAASDFSLEDSEPREGFQHMKHPKSFNATLAQVSNDGSTAFNVAHKNMDKIYHDAQDVGPLIGSTVKYILSPDTSPDELEDLVSIDLNDIEKIATDCQAHAEGVEAEFTEVLLLLHEVSEVLLVSKGTHEEKVKEIIANKAALTAQTEMLKERKEKLEAAQKKVEEQVEKAQKQFEKAMDSGPGFGEMILASLVDNVKTATAMLPALAEVAMKASPQGMAAQSAGAMLAGATAQAAVGATAEAAAAQAGGTAPGYTESKHQQEPQYQTTPDDRDAVMQGDIVKKLVEKLGNSLADKEENESDISDDIDGVRVGLQFVQENVGQNGKYASKLQNIVTEATDLINLIDEDSEELSDLISTADKIKGDSESFAMIAAATRNAPATVSTLTQTPNPQTADSSLVKNMVQDHQNKMQMASSHLERQEKRLDEQSDQITEQTNKLAEMLGKMASYDITKISYEKICAIIVEGINVMGDLQKQWNRLVTFFGQIATLVRSAIRPLLGRLPELVKVAQKQRLSDSATVHKMTRESIVETAIEAGCKAFVVETIARMYTEVSANFIQPNISGLYKLFAIEDDNERKRAMKKLTDDCNTAKDYIQKQVDGERRVMKKHIREKGEKYKELQKLLPPPGEETVKRIEAAKEAVQDITPLETTDPIAAGQSMKLGSFDTDAW